MDNMLVRKDYRLPPLEVVRSKRVLDLHAVARAASFAGMISLYFGLSLGYSVQFVLSEFLRLSEIAATTCGVAAGSIVALVSLSYALREEGAVLPPEAAFRRPTDWNALARYFSRGLGYASAIGGLGSFFLWTWFGFPEWLALLLMLGVSYTLPGAICWVGEAVFPLAKDQPAPSPAEKLKGYRLICLLSGVDFDASRSSAGLSEEELAEAFRLHLLADSCEMYPPNRDNKRAMVFRWAEFPSSSVTDEIRRIPVTFLSEKKMRLILFGQPGTSASKAIISDFKVSTPEEVDAAIRRVRSHFATVSIEEDLPSQVRSENQEDKP